MRDITVINRVRRMKVVWITESLCLQVDLFFRVLMIVMSLWHCKRLQLSGRCDDTLLHLPADSQEFNSWCWDDDTLLHLPADSQEFNSWCWDFSCLYCDSTSREALLGEQSIAGRRKLEILRVKRVLESLWGPLVFFHYSLSDSSFVLVLFPKNFL